MMRKKFGGCGRVHRWEEKREGKKERGRDKEGESGREKKRRERGRGSPLRHQKERGEKIIFPHHYFSLSRAEERRRKGGAGEGKELSLTRTRMRGGEKESRREGEKIGYRRETRRRERGVLGAVPSRRK